MISRFATRLLIVMVPAAKDDGVLPLVWRLVDDAGLFPPAELPMAAALARHRREAGTNPLLSGRFVCPAARLDELVSLLDAKDRLQLALIVQLDRQALLEALEAVSNEPRLSLTAVEGVMGSIGSLAEIPDGVPCFVEIPLTGEWRGAHRALRESGYGAKVRCGGAKAELFPTAAQLGAFVHETVASGVVFKATAGLHHAVAHRDDATGFSHHGFLNLLLATCRASDGASVDDVVEVLRSTAASSVVREVEQLDEAVVAAARELFVSYGSCSTSEPLDDLCELGLVSAPWC